MSQLIWRSPYSHIKDEVQMVFEGTASQTLAQALDHFSQAAIERAHRIVKGEIPSAPECIVENCQKLLDGKRAFQYTVVCHDDDTFSIYISDGPDRYDLID